MNLLELRDVTRRFGGVTAVDRCSFSVAAGSLTGLIGPNGAGKTTVFNLIAGSVKPDAGEIHLGGRRLGRLRPHQITRLGLSRTFQLTRELKDLTVLENIVIHAPTRGLADIFRSSIRKAERERAMSLLDLVGLARFADAPARGLSFGQKKLLELAAALMPEPKLILLDEPAAGVNPALLDAIVGYIEQVNQDGVTFLIVEHNMDLVMNLCDPVIVMAAGKVLAQGSPAQIQNDARVLEAYLGAGAPLPPPRAAAAEWTPSTILTSPSRSSLPFAARISESAPAAPRISESAPAAAAAAEPAPESAPEAAAAAAPEAAAAAAPEAAAEPAAAAAFAVAEAAVPESVALPAVESESESEVAPTAAAVPESEAAVPAAAIASAAIADSSTTASGAAIAADNAAQAIAADPVELAVPDKASKISKESKAQSARATSTEATSTRANAAKAKSAKAKTAKTAETTTGPAKSRTATGTAKIGTATTGTSKTGTVKTGTVKTGTAKTGPAKTGTSKTGPAKSRTAKTATAKSEPTTGTAKTAKAKTSKAMSARRSDRGNRGDGRNGGDGGAGSDRGDRDKTPERD